MNPDIKKEYERLQSILNYLDEQKQKIQDKILELRSKCGHTRTVPSSDPTYDLVVCVACKLVVQRTHKQ